jgi:hypothetical protein
MADLRGDGELAARLIGAASAAMERGEYRSPLDFILRDHHLSRLRGFLSPEALDRYIDEGRALSLSEAMDLGTQGSDVELTSTKPSERR